MSAVFSRYVTDWVDKTWGNKTWIDKARKFFLPIQNSIKNDTTWKSIVSWMLGYFLTMFNDFLIF